MNAVVPPRNISEQTDLDETGEVTVLVASDALDCVFQGGRSSVGEPFVEKIPIGQGS